MKKTNFLFTNVRILFASLLLTIWGMEVAIADTQVGRYVTVENIPTIEQKDVLRTIVLTDFPAEIDTVGLAVRDLLSTQGLRLGVVDAVEHRRGLLYLLAQPLPDIHRKLGPMSLKDALETLAGPSWYLVQDPLTRLISFEICRKRFGDE